MDISNFLNRVENWAKQNRDMQALILVGSHARGEARVDSDVDLVVITTNPDLYINNSFSDKFGKVIRFQK